MLLVPIALICIVHLTLTSLAFRNAKTSDKKDGRNIIPYGTELEAGALVEGTINGSACT